MASTRKTYVTVLGWVFCFLVLIDAILITLTSVGYFIFNYMKDVSHSPSSYFYTSLVVFVALCLLYFAIDAVVQENMFQLIAFLVVSLVLACVVILNFVVKFVYEGNSTAEWIVMASLTTIELGFQLLFLVFMVPVSRSFGWKVFKVVGTNAQLVRRYHIYEIWSSILKIDMMVTVAIGLMGGFFIIFETLTLIFFTICLTGNLLLSFICIWATRREVRPLVIGFIVWITALPIYLVYKIVMVWLFFPEDVRDFSDKGGQTRETVRIVLTIISVVAIAWRILLFVMSIWVTFNFGKGLDKVFSKEFGITPKQSKTSEINKYLLSNEPNTSEDHQTSNPIV